MKTKKVPVTKYADLVVIIEQDRSKDYHTASNAKRLMMCVYSQLSADLWLYLVGMLQGFSEEMQIEIADDILDFTNEKIVHMTGFPSVDTVLTACYELIAKEKGFKITDLQYYID